MSSDIGYNLFSLVMFCYLRSMLICITDRRLNTFCREKHKSTAQNTKQQLQPRHMLTLLSTGIPTRSYPYMDIFLFDDVTSLRDVWAGADAETGGEKDAH